MIHREQANALITVEIIISDRDDEKFAIGGPREQASAMAKALAQRLGVTPALAGHVLKLRMSLAELQPIMEWIEERFPSLGGVPLSNKSSPLAAAPAVGGVAVSPWREFSLRVAHDVRGDDDLVPTVAALVDILHRQVTDWALDPESPIGAVAESRRPILRVSVVPGERTVYVDRLPPDAELRKPRPSPYIDQPLQ